MPLTSLTAAAWKENFKNIGRLTMMRNIIGGNLPTVQSGIVVTAKKFASEDYLLVSGMMPTFINNMNTLASNMSSAKTNVDSSLTSYVTAQVKNDINSSATTASGILNDMFAQMRSDVCAVSGGGLFETMFGQAFGFLPQFFPRYAGSGGAPLISPDVGATTTPIRESYATFDWQDWNS